MTIDPTISAMTPTDAFGETGLARPKQRRGLEAIRGQVLFAAGDDAFTVAADLHNRESGLVLVGARTVRALRVLHATHPDMPLIADPKIYEHYIATAAAPFGMPSEKDTIDGLEPAGLQEVAQAQLDAGAALAVLPMGYLPPEDAAPLRAAVAQANELSMADVVLVVPADWTWLKKPSRDQFIAILKQCKHPVAIALNNRNNALDDADCLHGYRIFFEEIPNAIAWRTDHNGLGAIAHGAAAAVIGVRASLRHIAVQGDVSRSPKNKHPHVFIPDLMLWGKSNDLRANLFTTIPARGCASGSCAGASPDRFRDTEEDVLAAHLHNVDVFLADREAMLGSADAADWWRQRISGAVDAMEAFKTRAQKPRLRPRPDIENWFKEVN